MESEGALSSLEDRIAELEKEVRELKNNQEQLVHNSISAHFLLTDMMLDATKREFNDMMSHYKELQALHDIMVGVTSKVIVSDDEHS